MKVSNNGKKILTESGKKKLEDFKTKLFDLYESKFDDSYQEMSKELLGKFLLLIELGNEFENWSQHKYKSELLKYLELFYKNDIIQIPIFNKQSLLLAKYFLEFMKEIDFSTDIDSEVVLKITGVPTSVGEFMNDVHSNILSQKIKSQIEAKVLPQKVRMQLMTSLFDHKKWQNKREEIQQEIADLIEDSLSKQIKTKEEYNQFVGTINEKVLILIGKIKELPYFYITHKDFEKPLQDIHIVEADEIIEDKCVEIVDDNRNSLEVIPTEQLSKKELRILKAAEKGLKVFSTNEINDRKKAKKIVEKAEECLRAIENCERNFAGNSYPTEYFQIEECRSLCITQLIHLEEMVNKKLMKEGSSIVHQAHLYYYEGAMDNNNLTEVVENKQKAKNTKITTTIFNLRSKVSEALSASIDADQEAASSYVPFLSYLFPPTSSDYKLSHKTILLTKIYDSLEGYGFSDTSVTEWAFKILKQLMFITEIEANLDQQEKNDILTLIKKCLANISDILFNKLDESSDKHIFSLLRAEEKEYIFQSNFRIK